MPNAYFESLIDRKAGLDSDAKKMNHKTSPKMTKSAKEIKHEVIRILVS